MNRPVVIVPYMWMKQCWAYGQQTVDAYKAGLNEQSRALARNGIDTNIQVQTMGRVAEVAVCLWARLDPFAVLNWGNICDAGFDLVLAGFKFDIKASRNNAQYLIWPITKNHLFDAKQFDALALVRVNDARCELVGWIDKEIFRVHHDVAPDGHKLQPGTWFMHESGLYPFNRDAWSIAA